MKKLGLVAALVLLAACENPQLGIGATFGAGGVNVTPAVSGDVGGARGIDEEAVRAGG